MVGERCGNPPGRCRKRRREVVGGRELDCGGAGEVRRRFRSNQVRRWTQPDSPSASPGKPTADAAAASPVGEVKPEVFYVRDKDGRLVPVPGFSYEDFIRYYRLKQQFDQPDRSALQPAALTITGQTVGDRAELTAVFKVLVTTADWVRVPLRMNKLVLRSQSNIPAAARSFCSSIRPATAMFAGCGAGRFGT